MSFTFLLSQMSFGAGEVKKEGQSDPIVSAFEKIVDQNLSDESNKGVAKQILEEFKKKTEELQKYQDSTHAISQADQSQGGYAGIEKEYLEKYCQLIEETNDHFSNDPYKPYIKNVKEYTIELHAFRNTDSRNKGKESISKKKYIAVLNSYVQMLGAYEKAIPDSYSDLKEEIKKYLVKIQEAITSSTSSGSGNDTDYQQKIKNLHADYNQLIGTYNAVVLKILPKTEREQKEDIVALKVIVEEGKERENVIPDLTSLTSQKAPDGATPPPAPRYNMMDISAYPAFPPLKRFEELFPLGTTVPGAPGRLRLGRGDKELAEAKLPSQSFPVTKKLLERGSLRLMPDPGAAFRSNPPPAPLNPPKGRPKVTEEYSSFLQTPLGRKNDELAKAVPPPPPSGSSNEISRRVARPPLYQPPLLGISLGESKDFWERRVPIVPSGTPRLGRGDKGLPEAKLPSQSFLFTRKPRERRESLRLMPHSRAAFRSNPLLLPLRPLKGRPMVTEESYSLLKIPLGPSVEEDDELAKADPPPPPSGSPNEISRRVAPPSLYKYPLSGISLLRPEYFPKERVLSGPPNTPPPKRGDDAQSSSIRTPPGASPGGFQKRERPNDMRSEIMPPPIPPTLKVIPGQGLPVKQRCDALFVPSGSPSRFPGISDCIARVKDFFKKKNYRIY